MVLVTASLVPGTDHRHHRGVIAGLGPNVQTSGGVLPIDDLQGQDRSDRLRGGTLRLRRCGNLDWRSRDASAGLLLSCTGLARRRVDRRRRGWIRNLRVITWNYCTGDANTQRSYDCGWNRDSCCARRQRRPHGPSWARSRHVFSIPRKMRPKRYLPQESKQFDHDCPTLTPSLDGFFSSEGEISADLVIISLLHHAGQGARAAQVAWIDGSSLVLRRGRVSDPSTASRSGCP